MTIEISEKVMLIVEQSHYFEIAGKYVNCVAASLACIDNPYRVGDRSEDGRRFPFFACRYRDIRNAIPGGKVVSDWCWRRERNWTSDVNGE